VAEDAVRSEKVSAGAFSLQFAVCREIFRNCRESRFKVVKSNNDSKGLKELSLFTEQGVFFAVAGKK
jgi:hypothetical protein